MFKFKFFRICLKYERQHCLQDFGFNIRFGKLATPKF